MVDRVNGAGTGLDIECKKYRSLYRDRNFNIELLPYTSRAVEAVHACFIDLFYLMT